MSDTPVDNFMEQRRRVAAAYVNGDSKPLREISARADPARHADMLSEAKSTHRVERLPVVRLTTGSRGGSAAEAYSAFHT